MFIKKFIFWSWFLYKCTRLHLRHVIVERPWTGWESVMQVWRGREKRMKNMTFTGVDCHLNVCTCTRKKRIAYAHVPSRRARCACVDWKKKYALFFRFSHSPKNLCKCERRERLELEWLNWISLMMLKLIKLLKGMMHQIFRFKIEILKSNFIAGV